jgi:hypothetical protein
MSGRRDAKGAERVFQQLEARKQRNFAACIPGALRKQQTPSAIVERIA